MLPESWIVCSFSLITFGSASIYAHTFAGMHLLYRIHFLLTCFCYLSPSFLFAWCVLEVPNPLMPQPPVTVNTMWCHMGCLLGHLITLAYWSCFWWSSSNMICNNWSCDFYSWLTTKVCIMAVTTCINEYMIQ